MFDPATDDPENRRNNMGKLKSYAQDWLERGGDELGYHMGSLPNLSDFDGILTDSVSADEYFDKQEQEKGTENNDNKRKEHRTPSSAE